MNYIKFIFLIGLFLLQSIVPYQMANAIGTWYGQNTYHIPMSWCAVRGSPTVDAPNVPNPPNPNDVDTDSILWRRHERPTDMIWLDQAGITMRSGIHNDLTTLNFPKIFDPDPPTTNFPNRGIEGDVLDPGLDPTQIIRMINVCRDAYSPVVGPPNLLSDTTASWVGIPVVNVNLMHDNDGKYNFGAGFGRFATSGSVYTGDIVVVDNHYLYPFIYPRTFPGPSIDSSDQFSLFDPFDQLMGHELGHALGLAGNFDAYFLSHRNDNRSTLMYCCPTMQDFVIFPPGGYVDNFRLDNTPAKPEIPTARSMAIKVPNSEIDPLGKILKGEIVEGIKVDDINEKSSDGGNAPLHLDLSALRIILNTTENSVHLGHELMGIIPNQTKILQYWNLINTDNDNSSGADEEVLKKLGAPNANFTGTDLVTRTEVEGNNFRGSVWEYENGTMIPLPPSEFQADLIRMDGIVDYGVSKNGSIFPSRQFPMNHIVSMMVDNNYSQIDMRKPFNVQAISIDKDLTTEPNTNNSDMIQSKFVIDRISFPHCFPQSNATAGQNVTVDVDGLTPNSGIHGLIGPMTVFHGQTDKNGNATIQFPIPTNTNTGVHLVTIGVDKTALTADCEVNVIRLGSK
jgi:hypothetical protein